MRESVISKIRSHIEDIFRDRTRLIRIMLIILILLLALAVRVRENSKADITVESDGGTALSDEICVDIGGAVVNPGVYNVSRDTRLYEVIELAGGLISSADTDSINRAAFVEDGEKIIIPSRPVQQVSGDPAAAADQMPETTQAEDTVSGQEDLTSSSQSGLININYATKEELKTLSGIGDSKADSIIEYRASKKFKKKEDIKSVNGIGDSIYNKIKDSITV